MHDLDVVFAVLSALIGLEGGYTTRGGSGSETTSGLLQLLLGNGTRYVNYTAVFRPTRVPVADWVAVAAANLLLARRCGSAVGLVDRFQWSWKDDSMVTSYSATFAP
jgi:hypothetical protein